MTCVHRENYTVEYRDNDGYPILHTVDWEQLVAKYMTSDTAVEGFVPYESAQEYDRRCLLDVCSSQPLLPTVEGRIGIDMNGRCNHVVGSLIHFYHTLVCLDLHAASHKLPFRSQ